MLHYYFFFCSNTLWIDIIHNLYLCWSFKIILFLLLLHAAGSCRVPTDPIQLGIGNWFPG